MKQYEIDVDITMSKRIAVEAESEEQARALLNGWMKYNPFKFAHSFDAYVKHEITDVNEEEPDEDEDVDAALDYVREQLDADELMIIKSRVSYNLNHRLPAASEVNDGRIIDLLEEYGEDNDLPEGWWEEYGDIDDILLKL